MDTPLELRPDEAQRQYLKTYQQDVDQVDELVNFLTQSQDNWAPSALIRMWPEVSEAFLDQYGNPANYKAAHIAVATEILTKGSIDDVRIDVDHAHYKIGGWNHDWPASGKGTRDAMIAYERRLFFAHLAVTAPADFKTIRDHDIFAFHGTKGLVLPGIIAQKSLLSHYDQHLRGLPVGNGEVHVADLRRKFISFASISQGTAMTYAETDLRSPHNLNYLQSGGKNYPGLRLRADEVASFDRFLEQQINEGNSYLSLAEKTRFGVMVGLSQSALWMAGIDPLIGRRLNVDSDITEFGFAHQVSTNYLPVIAVPNHYRNDVSDLMTQLSHDGALVSSNAIEYSRRTAMDISISANKMWRERQ